MTSTAIIIAVEDALNKSN
ncbi:hypothetical protein [Alkalibaculum sporogenes]